ncbi:acetyl-CoA acetyltransferase, mitochondrial-like [Panonychus citri]|uniref:acetyl-CoA acetyltransferase, mitochondrial-like n=1 Tax=Panonychus citri TaxID=50023 RepID=UPI002307CEEC|nr:acetyl-CoA acetyltransferase, mitochondrial-like [Panonychus citri]XP_053210978.1 acetyl-CoA acetyltransferase, mitochondrial-like [Panonychus citri]
MAILQLVKSSAVRSIRQLSNASGSDVVVVSALRTPIGSFRGSLSQLSAAQMATQVFKALISQSGLKPEQIDEVIMGHILTHGGGQHPTRQAVINSGLPSSTVTSTVNKLCASGMKSLMLASGLLSLKQANIMIAGGMESMSNVPYVLKRGDTNYGHTTLHDALLSDGLMDAFHNIHMGNCGENTAKKYGITREDQDKFAISSYEKSAAAAKSGLFDKERISVTVPDRKTGTKTISDDEEYHKVDFGKLASLKSVFQKDGTITAANSSKLNDGAAGCILMRSETAKEHGLKPLIRIVDYADNELDPIDFPVAPVGAIKKLLSRNGISKDDVKMWEINEAFSCVPLAHIKILELDSSKVNIHGGAVALGHPVAASGTRIVAHLAHTLKSGEFGIAAICNGGGGSSAMLVQAV